MAEVLVKRPSKPSISAKHRPYFESHDASFGENSKAAASGAEGLKPCKDVTSIGDGGVDSFRTRTGRTRVSAQED